MLNRSNNDSLNSLLLVQEHLKPVTAGTQSLNAALPEILISILEAVGCRDGHLEIINLEPGTGTAVSVVNGLVEIETSDSLPEPLKAHIENFVQQQGRELYIADTQNEDSWSVASHPETATSSWSAVCTPLRTEGLAVGLLTMLKPGRDRFVQQDILLSSLFAGQIEAALTTLQLQEELLSAERHSRYLLQDNQDLAAILVHDLQGPLGNVLTSLEMVQEGLAQQAESGLSLMMDIAVRSSKQLQTLVHSLLDIGRLEAGQKVTDRRPVSVSELLEYVAEAEGPVLEQRQVTLSQELSPGLPLINVNADIIQRVLLNLFDNALKVSKPGQVIAIRANVENGDGAVRISIVDQGPGIPTVDRERIFEKYQRINGISASKGLGLGLAFCKLAVEAHGGRIWVEDAPVAGACFCFTLPIEASPDPAS